MVKIVVDGKTIETERHNVIINDDNTIDIDNSVFKDLIKTQDDRVKWFKRKEFKLGDNVYFLIEEHGFGSSPIFIDNLNVRCEVIQAINSDYIKVSHVESCICKTEAYLSYDDVITKLIKQMMIK